MSRKHPAEELDISIALEYKKQCNINNKISYKELFITEEAQITIGNAITKIAEELNITTDILTKSITENLFNVNGELVIIIDIPDFELENIITIPKKYWNYKKNIKTNNNITYH